MQKFTIIDHATSSTKEVELVPNRLYSLLDNMTFEFRFSNEDDNSDDCYENFEKKILEQFDEIYSHIENITYIDTYKCKFRKTVIKQKIKLALIDFAEHTELNKSFCISNVPFFDCCMTVSNGVNYPEILVVNTFCYRDSLNEINKILNIYRGKPEDFHFIK
jgi:hypothetical protein